MQKRRATPQERDANSLALREIETLFPSMPREEVGEWLVNCTAYPCGSLPDCMEYIRDLAKRSNGDHNKCYQLADEDVRTELRRLREQEEHGPRTTDPLDGYSG